MEVLQASDNGVNLSSIHLGLAMCFCPVRDINPDNSLLLWECLPLLIHAISIQEKFTTVDRLWDSGYGRMHAVLIFECDMAMIEHLFRQSMRDCCLGLSTQFPTSSETELQ